MTLDNKKIVKKYLKRYFSSSWLNENDDEFKSLVRILNKKDKQLKSKVEAISDEMIEEIEENARKKGYSESLITGIRVGIDIVKQKLLKK